MFPAPTRYVSEEEYPAPLYPDYCAGWAYLTTLPTVAALLDMVYSTPQLWIDDLYVSTQGSVPSHTVPKRR